MWTSAATSPPPWQSFATGIDGDLLLSGEFSVNGMLYVQRRGARMAAGILSLATRLSRCSEFYLQRVGGDAMLQGVLLRKTALRHARFHDSQGPS